jgi:RimJ/RimL family protein N-acetyltransferase
VGRPLRAENNWYENSVRDGHGKTGLWFVISPLGGSEFLGTSWLWNRDARLHGPASAELSIYIGDPGRWGSGIGTAAVNATVDARFGSWPFGKIWLFTSAENERSQRAFAKAGFALDGRLRQQISAAARPVTPS